LHHCLGAEYANGSQIASHRVHVSCRDCGTDLIECINPYPRPEPTEVSALKSVLEPLMITSYGVVLELGEPAVHWFIN